MFIGHFAVGFASKKFAPHTSLGPLIAAPILADMLWPVFLLLGWENVRVDPGNTKFTPLDFYHYPWSHSLLMDGIWATAFAGIYYLFARYRTGAVVLWIGVISHWILDWITHRPDMPLYPGGRGFGLGLWNSIAGTMAVELSMLATGVWLYVHATRPRDRIGRWGFVAFVALLLGFYVSDRFSAPPESISVLAWTAIVGEFLVLIPWAWWFDRHRETGTA